MNLDVPARVRVKSLKKILLLLGTRPKTRKIESYLKVDRFGNS